MTDDHSNVVDKSDAELRGFWSERFLAHRASGACPSLPAVAEWFQTLLGALFEQHAHTRYADKDEFEGMVGHLKTELAAMVAQTLSITASEGRTLADSLFGSLPAIRLALVEDAEATLSGDPAARDLDEVIRAYPGFVATAAHRLAHVLYDLGASLVARLVSSAAHRLTGIDIHPAASLGRRFCIDHGTGIVIGETTIIGDDVKLYQGVTLGGLSVSKTDAAVKRHPTIGDRVVIYSGATILGGSTTVGHDSVIGGNVWLTTSVPPHSRLTYRDGSTNAVGRPGPVAEAGSRSPRLGDQGREQP